MISDLCPILPLSMVTLSRNLEKAGFSLNLLPIFPPLPQARLILDFYNLWRPNPRGRRPLFTSNRWCYVLLDSLQTQRSVEDPHFHPNSHDSGLLAWASRERHEDHLRRSRRRCQARTKDPLLQRRAYSSFYLHELSLPHHFRFLMRRDFLPWRQIWRNRSWPFKFFRST